MSYLVLARKYRPTTFADLVGQEQVCRTLKNALATGRVAHAYLFSGPRGVGKTTAARLLAMSMSCLAEKVEDRPCGQCENCLEIQSGQAVDVIEVDGASNRGINEIRDLRETVKYLPAKGRYKVYIIDEVHALTKDAFNALLKTLEEPPPHVVFIFATTETHKVLPTILSRCQRYDFRRIRVDDITARLAKVAELENIPAEPEALELIARQAEGGLRDSLSLMDQAIAAGGGELTADNVRRSLGLIDQTLVHQLVTETLAGRAPEALSALDEAYLRGYDFKDLGGKILEFIRALTLIKVDKKNAALMNLTETEENTLTGEAGQYSLETLNRHFDAWLKFQRELNYSPQPRWLLEAQIIRLAQLAPLLPVSELVERLGRLLAENPPLPRPAAIPGNAAPATGFALPQSSAPAGQPVSIARAPKPTPPENTSEVAPVEQIPTGTAPSLPEAAPANWGDFMRQYGSELDAMRRAMLKGAIAEAFGPEQVTLKLSHGAGLCSATEKPLKAQLLNSLQKAFGQAPMLVLDQDADPAQDAGLLEERLLEVKKKPAVIELMAAIPGQFVEFRLTQPETQATATQEETSPNIADEPQYDYPDDDEDDHDD